ncbi:hypothetical protein ADUPG1_005987, partial [Aduncisulcus paluster]
MEGASKKVESLRNGFKEMMAVLQSQPESFISKLQFIIPKLDPKVGEEIEQGRKPEIDDIFSLDDISTKYNAFIDGLYFILQQKWILSRQVRESDKIREFLVHQKLAIELQKNQFLKKQESLEVDCKKREKNLLDKEESIEIRIRDLAGKEELAAQKEIRILKKETELGQKESTIVSREKRIEKSRKNNIDARSQLQTEKKELEEETKKFELERKKFEEEKKQILVRQKELEDLGKSLDDKQSGLQKKEE